MANFKKGIALALVATTAFTFAPVANLGTPVVAEAATYAEPIVATTQDNFGNINLTEGQKAAYRVTVPNVATGFTYNVSTSNVNVAALQVVGDSAAVANKDNVANGTAFYVEAQAGKAGESATIKVEYTVNGNKVVKSFVVTVVALSNAPAWSVSGAFAKDGVLTDQILSTTSANNDRVLTASAAANGDKFDIIKVTSDKTDVIEVKTQAAADISDWTLDSDAGATLTFKKKGTATLTIEANVNTTEGVKKKTYKLTFNVIPADSTMKIGDVEVTGNAPANAPVKTIVLSGVKLSDSIGAVLEDPQSKTEKLVYSVYRVNKEGAALDVKTGQTTNGTEDATSIDAKANKTKDIVLDGDKVTATANALNASEQYYNVLIANNETSASVTKSTWVRLVTIRNQKAFTNVEVKVDNAKDALKAEASYDKDGSVLDKLDVEGNVTLSTKDLTSLAVTSTSNVAASNFTIKSNDPSTVAVEDGKLVAKKVGVAAVTFKAISDADHYGNAQVTLNVNVTDQAVANKIKGEDVALTATARKATIKAASDYPTTFSYKLVKKNSDGTYTGTSNDSLKLDEKTGEIEYVGDEKGTAYVQISGVATTESRTPISTVITVTYTAEKAASKLAVVTKSVNVEAGKTATIVATGTALTFTSSDETVATVAADGTVTGVKAGVAVVTVTDAGDENTEGGSVDVPVFVTAKAAPVVVAKPAKVSGLKVANVKGAKVKVSFKKSAKATGYLVSYKVGKKTVKKNTTKTALNLSVKKGATVKVTVKAFNKNAKGAKQYSAAVSKSLKTDKK